jgi:hypothetical protein
MKTQQVSGSRLGREADLRARPSAWIKLKEAQRPAPGRRNNRLARGGNACRGMRPA